MVRIRSKGSSGSSSSELGSIEIAEQSESLLRQREKDVVLARKVAVDRGRAVFDSLGNLADGNVLVTLGDEQFPGGVENSTPYRLAVALLAFLNAHGAS